MMNTHRFQEHAKEVLTMVSDELREYENITVEYSPDIEAAFTPEELCRAENSLLSGILYSIIAGFRDFNDYYCLDNRILRAGFDKEKMRIYIGIDEEATARWQGRVQVMPT